MTTDTDPGDAAATIDGRQSTWWTALDRGRLTYDLGRRRTVDKIGISFRRGDARATGIRVLTSRDRIHWGVAVSALSSSETSGQEIFDFPDRRARFVKIVTLGNSLGGRASISEIHVY